MGGKHMMKTFKKVTFTFLISSVLTFGVLAMPIDQGRPKDNKPREQPKETPKQGDRGGRDKGEKKDKKPFGGF